MIRGYYGDLVTSPYIGFGLQTDASPENKYFWKQRNERLLYVIKK